LSKNIRRLLLHTALSILVFSAWLIFFVSHDYVISAVAFLAPLGVLAAVQACSIWPGATRDGVRFYIVVSGVPISGLFLLFALANHRFLVIPFLGTMLLATVVAKRGATWVEYPGRAVSLAAAGALVFSLVVFLALPTSRALELQLFGEQNSRPLSEILSQPGVTPIITATWVHPEQSGRPRTLEIDYFGSATETDAQFDPYMIEWRPPGLLVVSYERRHRLEKLDLTTRQATHVDFDRSVSMFFFDERDPSTVFTGHSFSTEASAAAVEVNVPQMSVASEFPLSDQPRQPYQNGIAGFRTGFATDDALYVMRYNCELIRLTKDRQPQAHLKARSMICNHVRYAPQSDSAYLTGTPFFLHRVDIRNFRSAGFRFMPLSQWVEPVPGRAEVAANGFNDVKILHATTLKTLRTIPAKTGIRCLAIDPRRNVVYVAQYFDGELAAYDLDSGELKNAYYMGQQIRFVHYAQTPDRVYTGSSQGVFEIDPDVFLPATPPASSPPL